MNTTGAALQFQLKMGLTLLFWARLAYSEGAIILGMDANG